MNLAKKYASVILDAAEREHNVTIDVQFVNAIVDDVINICSAKPAKLSDMDSLLAVDMIKTAKNSADARRYLTAAKLNDMSVDELDEYQAELFNALSSTFSKVLGTNVHLNSYVQNSVISMIQSNQISKTEISNSFAEATETYVQFYARVPADLVNTWRMQYSNVTCVLKHYIDNYTSYLLPF